MSSLAPAAPLATYENLLVEGLRQTVPRRHLGLGLVGKKTLRPSLQKRQEGLEIPWDEIQQGP